MTPQEYLTAFRRRWRTIVVAVLVGLVVAGVVTVLSPRQYEAEATIFVTAQPRNPDAGMDANELSSQRMSTYVELVRSPKTVGEVASILGPAAPPDLLNRITAARLPETTLLQVTVRDRSPEGAAQIANLLAERFVVDLAALEQPADLTAPPQVVGRIYAPAVAVNRPVSPQIPLNLALGLVIGLMVGVGAAAVREHWDTSVRSTGDLRAALDTPVLGWLGQRPKSGSQLVVRDRRRSPEAEDYRRLRTNLQYLDNLGERPVILVTSARQDEGKTTALCNLALAFADAGKRVMVIDADLRQPGAASLFGLERAVGLTDVLTYRTRLSKALQRWEDVLVLPSGPIPSNPGELLGLPETATLIDDARELCDLVLVDSPPISSAADAAVLAPHTDGVLLVVQHGSTTAEQVHAAREALDIVGARVLGAVLSEMPRSVRSRYLGRAAQADLTPEIEPSVAVQPPLTELDGGTARPTDGARDRSGAARAHEIEGPARPASPSKWS
jgi:capsular exopolysaccharide synthesis family protein